MEIKVCANQELVLFGAQKEATIGELLGI